MKIDDLCELLAALETHRGEFPNFVMELVAEDESAREVLTAAVELVSGEQAVALGRFVLHVRVRFSTPEGPGEAVLAEMRDLAARAPRLGLSQMLQGPRQGWVQLWLPGEDEAAHERDAPVDLSSVQAARGGRSDMGREQAEPWARRGRGLPSLAERLGFSDSDIVVIVNADDFGLCHAANDAVLGCLREGVLTSASLMVPCPWAGRGRRVGRLRRRGAPHAELRVGRLPVVPAERGATLRDRWGMMRRTAEDVWLYVDPAEAGVEMEAQLVRALEWGVDVTHLDAHMHIAQLITPLLGEYLELARRYALPARTFGGGPGGSVLDGGKGLAGELGVVSPDRVVVGFDSMDPLAAERLAEQLSPGVTELYVHPAAGHPEAQALAPDWARRVADRDALVCGGVIDQALQAAGAQLIGWRTLRDLQRSS